MAIRKYERSKFLAAFYVLRLPAGNSDRIWRFKKIIGFFWEFEHGIAQKTLIFCYFERKIAGKEHSDAHDVFVDRSSRDERPFGQSADDECRAARSQEKTKKKVFTNAATALHAIKFNEVNIILLVESFRLHLAPCATEHIQPSKKSKIK